MAVSLVFALALTSCLHIEDTPHSHDADDSTVEHSGTIFADASESPSLGDACTETLKGGLVGETIIRSLRANHMTFSEFVCSANFENHNAAIGAGLAVDTEVYGEPLRVNGTFDSDGKQQWMRQSCTNRSTSRDAYHVIRQAVSMVRREQLDAWTNCVEQLPVEERNCAALFHNGAISSASATSISQESSAWNSFFCSNSFTRHETLLSLGFGLGATIYGVPLESNGRFSSTQVDTWKSENCGTAGGEETTAESLNTIISFVEADVVNAYTRCLTFGRPGFSCGGLVDEQQVLVDVAWSSADGEALQLTGVSASSGVSCQLDGTQTIAPGTMHYIQCTRTGTGPTRIRVTSSGTGADSACVARVYLGCGRAGEPCCSGAMRCRGPNLACLRDEEGTERCSTCMPRQETCDGVDEDCDGLIDEDAGTEHYRDRDGDGHGDATVSVRACEGAVPSGYVVTRDDCYDFNPDVFPGQSRFFEGHRGDRSFDYDCSGGEEPQFTNINTEQSCGGWPGCSENDYHSDTWWGSRPACGQRGTLLKDCDSGWRCHAEVSSDYPARCR